MGPRDKTTASAASAAAAGVATLMMLTGCGGAGGSPAAGRASGGAAASVRALGGQTATSSTSGAGSPVGAGTSSGAGSGGGTGNGGNSNGGNPANGLLPTVKLTGAAGAAITAACKDAGTAWSVFQSAYGAATTNPDKATAAATGASALTTTVHTLTQAVGTNATPSYFLRAQEVEQHGTAVSKDLQDLSNDLRTGDANAASILYSSSNPVSPIQLDETAFASVCGT